MEQVYSYNQQPARGNPADEPFIDLTQLDDHKKQVALTKARKEKYVSTMNTHTSQ